MHFVISIFDYERRTATLTSVDEDSERVWHLVPTMRSWGVDARIFYFLQYYVSVWELRSWRTYILLHTVLCISVGVICVGGQTPEDGVICVGGQTPTFISLRYLTLMMRTDLCMYDERKRTGLSVCVYPYFGHLWCRRTSMYSTSTYCESTLFAWLLYLIIVYRLCV